MRPASPCTRLAGVAALTALTLLGARGARAQYLRHSFKSDASRARPLYESACAACHGSDGTGAPPSLTVFKRPSTFPNFTRCDQTTAETDTSYKAVITKGGPGFGFSQIMPSFSEAFSSDEIDDLIAYVRRFCPDGRWPAAELNLPLAQGTEKAYPENEEVLHVAVNARGAPGVENHWVHEQRFGARNQLELDVPVLFQDQEHVWYGGLGDMTLALKRVLFADLKAGSILTLQGGFVLPTGSRERGFGTGTTAFEPFGAFDQLFRTDTFVQLQGGASLPFDERMAPKSVFFNAAVGQSLAQDRGLGRLWSPMCEFLAARDLVSGAPTYWDVLPQLQVTLNKRQHVRANAGFRVPLTHTAGRQSQAAFYVLWDWAEGSFLEGW